MATFLKERGWHTLGILGAFFFLMFLQTVFVWGIWNGIIAYFFMYVVFGREPVYISLWIAFLMGIALSVIRYIFFGNGNN